MKKDQGSCVQSIWFWIVPKDSTSVGENFGLIIRFWISVKKRDILFRLKISIWILVKKKNTTKVSLKRNPRNPESGIQNPVNPQR